MPIDDCNHNFLELAQRVLPEHMSEMRRSLASPTPMAEFLVPRQGVKTLLRAHNRTTDFSGCYVLLEQGKPIYVGISRQVFRRLWYHGRGTKHFTATLAYSIAAHQFVSELPRSARMADADFLVRFNLAKLRLQKCDFAFVEITNDLVLYLFEAYCAMELDTSEWNTFRTH
jgi:hypothetical protein